MAARKAKPSVTSSDLRAVVDSLDMIEQEGCSVGTLISAVVAVDLDGTKVTATYGNGEWAVAIESGVAP